MKTYREGDEAMPPSKGYRSYRGRGSKLKVALAVVLVLIILLALSFMAMTRYIAYDEDGRPFSACRPRRRQTRRRLPRGKRISPGISRLRSRRILSSRGRSGRCRCLPSHCPRNF